MRSIHSGPLYSNLCIYFQFIILAITCDPLVPADNYLISRCPTGHSYGSACHFSCSLDYILKGDESVTCELGESGRHGKWAWTNDTETFCEKLSLYYYKTFMVVFVVKIKRTYHTKHYRSLYLRYIYSLCSQK
jgi:hypothetical protein